MGKLLYENLTYKIIGICYEIHNELGPIHKEKIYQKALERAFEDSSIQFSREVNLPVVFKGRKVGAYKPDFIIENKVILEIKAVNFITKSANSQLTYYLKGTNYKIGLLVNFGSKSLDIRRRIYG